MAIYFAFVLIQVGAWVYINKPKAGFIIKLISTASFLAATVIFAIEFGIETGVSFSILVIAMIIMVNILLKDKATK